MTEKILMVCFVFPPQFGGATIQGIRLSKELLKRQVDLAILADNDLGADEDTKFEGVPLFRRRTWSAEQRFSKMLVWALRVIFFIIAHPSFKIIHFHGIRGPEILIFPFLKLMRKKIVLKITLAGEDDPLTFATRRNLGGLYLRWLKFVDRYVSISPTLSEMTQSAGMDASKIILLPNGVDAQKYGAISDDQRTAVRKKLGLPLTAEIILAVGAVEFRKGYDLLIDAFKLIKRERVGAILLVAGPGNHASNEFYTELLQRLGAENATSVIFLGQRDDVHALMEAANLFAFCSRREGFGTVVAEAMCAGIPVVTMDIPGVTEWIVGGLESGHNCLGRDVNEFATACVRFLAEFDLTRRQQQSIKAKSRFSFDAVGQQYLEMYKNMT